MNKLLLLALVGFALIALTGGEEHESEVAQAQLEHSRFLREADPAKEKTSVNKEKKKSGKGKKKSGKSKNKSGKSKKKSGKAAKKSGKSKKKSGKAKKKSEKAAKKSGEEKKKSGKEAKKSGEEEKKSGKEAKKSGEEKKKSGKAKKKSGKAKKKSGKAKKKSGKAKKKSGKSKKKSGKAKKKSGKAKKKSGKEKKKSGKEKKKSGKETKSGKQSSTCAVDEACVTKAVGYMKTMKDKVVNYLKQKGRIEKQNTTGMKKSDKKDVFKPAINRLTEAGGGNASALACGGDTANAGAAQMKNLTETLMKCSDEVKTACDPSALPQPDMAQVEVCAAAMATFETELEKCRRLTGADACTCWASDALSTSAATIKTCSLKTEADAMAAALSTCRSSFGTCRKYEDAIGDIIHSCSANPDALKSKLKSLAANSASLELAKANVETMTARKGQVVRSLTTCAEVAAALDEALTLVSQNPASTLIAALGLEIAASTATCTTAEKEALKAKVAEIDEAIVAILEESAIVQETILELLGATASPAEIDDASDCLTPDCSSLEDPVTTAEPTSTMAMPVSTAMPTTMGAKRRRQAVEDILKSRIV